MELRIARQTGRLALVSSFYEDDLGLIRIGAFEDHAGYSGVLLRVPGTKAHLEFVETNEMVPPASHPESLLVLYLGDWDAVHRTAKGRPSCVSSNPYWDLHGVTVLDPDGFGVVLVAGSWSD